MFSADYSSTQPLYYGPKVNCYVPYWNELVQRISINYGFHESLIRISLSAVRKSKIDTNLFLYVALKATDHAFFKPAVDAAEKHMISLFL